MPLFAVSSSFSLFLSMSSSTSLGKSKSKSKSGHNNSRWLSRVWKALQPRLLDPIIWRLSLSISWCMNWGMPLLSLFSCFCLPFSGSLPSVVLLESFLVASLFCVSFSSSFSRRFSAPTSRCWLPSLSPALFACLVASSLSALFVFRNPLQSISSMSELLQERSLAVPQHLADSYHRTIFSSSQQMVCHDVISAYCFWLRCFLSLCHSNAAGCRFIRFLCISQSDSSSLLILRRFFSASLLLLCFVVFACVFLWSLLFQTQIINDVLDLSQFDGKWDRVDHLMSTDTGFITGQRVKRMGTKWAVDRNVRFSPDSLFLFFEFSFFLLFIFRFVFLSISVWFELISICVCVCVCGFVCFELLSQLVWFLFQPPTLSLMFPIWCILLCSRIISPPCRSKLH